MACQSQRLQSSRDFKHLGQVPMRRGRIDCSLLSLLSESGHLFLLSANPSPGPVLMLGNRNVQDSGGQRTLISAARLPLLPFGPCIGNSSRIAEERDLHSVHLFIHQIVFEPLQVVKTADLAISPQNSSACPSTKRHVTSRAPLQFIGVENAPPTRERQNIRR